MKERIAVIGSGVAGIVASYLLSQRFEVTLFEKQNRLGGHTNTIVVQNGEDAGLGVDTGFIVLNDRTYPNFEKFLERLQVPVRDADMSFGFYDHTTGLQYAGTGLKGLFAQPKNLFSPQFLQMLRALGRFNSQAMKDFKEGKLEGLSLADYLKKQGISDYFRDNYLVPMGAAIWSSPDIGITDFPASFFVRFFKNHGLLTLSDRPQWRTVEGGSHSYLRAFEKVFSGEIALGSSIRSVQRHDSSVTIKRASGESQSFDKVVFATHADQVLDLLADASAHEKQLFSSWTYQLNKTVLHTDRRVLPPSKRAWASWNYTRELQQDGSSPVSITYHMNRLQGFTSSSEYCVTLNRRSEIDPHSIIREIDYHHPVFTPESVATQDSLRELSGKNNTYFCGSYFGFGFHEDAVTSAVEVGNKLGVEL